LADQLAKHIKDIDIYHTGYDRPEYNHGLFWHTNHYYEAGRATHRCFSADQIENRNRKSYGGGLSLSHIYTSGLLLHYYLTGNQSSKDALQELFEFLINNVQLECTIGNRLLQFTKKLVISKKNKLLNYKGSDQFIKVYGLEGPGRASGNALNSLIDGYLMTNDNYYLETAENLIKLCVHPGDDIIKRDYLDTENRWMYTIFFQSLGKYLDLKTELKQIDNHWEYARRCLINTAEWMAGNEYLYLDKPEKLEFPNETWAAQEFRKCVILLYAAKYSKLSDYESYRKKAFYYSEGGLQQLSNFPTKTLTRPIILLLTNSLNIIFYKKHNLLDSKQNTLVNCSDILKGKTLKKIESNTFANSTINLLKGTTLLKEARFITIQFISKLKNSNN
jgi:hypothetical protein